MPGVKVNIKKLSDYKQNKFSPDLKPGTIIKSKFVVSKDGQLYCTGRLINTERRIFSQHQYFKLQYFANVIVVTKCVNGQEKLILLVANNGIIQNSTKKYIWSENHYENFSLMPCIIIKSERKKEYYYIDSECTYKFKTFTCIKEFIICTEDVAKHESIVRDSNYTYYLNKFKYTKQYFDINIVDPVDFYNKLVDIKGKIIYYPGDYDYIDGIAINFENYQERGLILISDAKVFEGKSMETNKF